MPTVEIKNQEHWHQVRALHVGASEVAALFNLSPWVTRWQLHMMKAGKLPDVFESNAMTQGKHFEPAVASYAQEKFGITLRKVRRYLSHDSVKLGASLDYEEIGTGSLIPTELKFSLWGDGWEYEGDDLLQIPEYYLLQVQAQLACSPAAPHGQLIAFTGGDLKRMVIPRSETIISRILEETTSFWSDIAAGKEPPVDFSVDAEAVGRLAYISKLRSVTLPQEAAPLFERYTKAKAEWDAAEAVADATKAELLKMVIDSGEGNDEKTKAVCGQWSLAVSKIADSPGKEVTAEMVGTMIGARRGHSRCTIKRVEAK